MDRPGIDRDILGAYGRYPLVIKIPQAEMNGGTIGLRYTQYLIEVDDCGKVFTRGRRYTLFAWLHAELRRKELACALPELPPKKLFGNRDQAFVDRRRQMLEDYLRALLMLPAVIQDGMIWAFLDADEATAVVPRFLCRQPTHAAADKCLSALKRAVADKEVEIFRLCDSSVLEELANFALAEASEAAASAPQQAQQVLQMRLFNRMRLCFILMKIICYDAARQNVVKSGLFGALLALLWRATEDQVAAGAAASENHRNGCFAATDCLKRLIQESHGEALLYFCQQDGALEALKRLTTAESTSLHAVCAWLLWHGLRCGGVITALAGVQGASSTRGLALLGRLLQSVDLGARVLASLCIGAIVRCEGALDADTRDFCLRALAVLPSELDAAEEAALAAAARDDLQKGSLRELAKPQSLASLPASEPEPFRKESEAASHSSFESRLRRGSKTKADDKNEFSVSDSTADSKSAVSKLPVPQRDPALVKLLGEICSSKELSRMQMLLGPCQAKDDYGSVDTVTACMVAILDHFVQQCTDKDSARIHDLLPLMPQLQKLVEGDEDGQMVEGGVGGAAAGEPPPQQVTREEVRVRASRVLLRLAKEANHEATREPPQLEAFGPRAHILEVLMRHSEACQVGASGHVSQTQEHCQAQGDHIAAGGLAEEPCVNQQTLQDFCEQLRKLAESRHALGLKMGGLRNGLEGMVVSLDQRRVKYGILGQDVQELCRSLHAMAGDTTRSTEVHAELSHCEELERQSVGEVEQLSAKLREAQAWNHSSATKVKEAEKHAAELSSKEAELADFCNQVPAKLQQHQSRLVDVATQRADAAARRAALGLEADRCERRIAALRSAAAEAATALRALEDVSQELEVLKSSLNSELVMSAGEVEKLRSLGARLVPAKPGRMRRSANNASEEESDAVMAPSSFREAIAPDAETPAWDSAAEEEFRENENFRSFKKLRDEKERLWQKEKRWLQECLDHAETAASKLDQQRREAQSLEHQSATEEGDLQKEIAILEDVEGHAQRHLDARAAADAARASQRELATIAAEAAAAEWAAKAQLEKAQANAAQVAVQLDNARKAAANEEDETLKVRRELQKRFLELETRVREFVQDWRAFEHDGQRLTLLQERVTTGLHEESEGRRAVRSEVQKLIGILQDLDQQLDFPEA